RFFGFQAGEFVAASEEHIGHAGGPARLYPAGAAGAALGAATGGGAYAQLPHAGAGAGAGGRPPRFCPARAAGAGAGRAGAGAARALGPLGAGRGPGLPRAGTWVAAAPRAAAAAASSRRMPRPVVAPTARSA
nr:hypothetical protein [Tanacetum cinerariifolium]